MTKCNIKVAFFDLDGTLTDGMYHVGANGELTKSFNTKDFKGLSELHEEGIQVHIITHSDDSVIHQKVKELKFPIEIHHLSGDKAGYIEKWCQENDFDVVDNVAFMGDDIGDLTAMAMVYFNASPKDSHYTVRNISRYKCRLKGGKGAVREFCDFILLENERK
jgi:3-deoxy-D-manno-octulosonate 8-phosphate phosphatase (KDO 8-P phosphatase)